MRELLVAKKDLRDVKGGTLRLEYYVLVEEASLGETFCCETYGVRVAEGGGEEAVVPNITASTRRIDELMELLIQGGVTPATLQDVVEDWAAAG